MTILFSYRLLSNYYKINCLLSVGGGGVHLSSGLANTPLIAF